MGDAPTQDEQTATPGADDVPALFDESPFESGFSWRIVIGAAFVGLVMVPGSIYMGLVSGRSIAGAAEWVTIILFIEIGKRSFIQMRKQEIILLYWVASGLLAAGATLGAGAVLFGGPFSQMIWDQYLVQSPQAEGFGIADKIPFWRVPTDPSVLKARSFFQWSWFWPIVLLVVHSVLQYCFMLAAGYVMYRITNDVERLEFPLAPVHAGGATALAESSSKTETWRWRAFSIGSMIGVGFGALYLGVPTITGVFAAEPVMLLPIPFADATEQLSAILPAAIFGLVPDLTLVMIGFVLPWHVVLGLFCGSILCQLVLNPVFYHYGLLTTWRQGMSVIPTTVVNWLDVWLSIGIGLALCVALIGIGSIARQFIRVSRQRSGQDQDGEERRRYLKGIEGRGHFPLAAAIAVVAGLTMVYVLLCKILVPSFSLWILLLFGFVISPLMSYVTARMIGITGNAAGAAFPYIREAAFIFSGYQGVAIWFAPVPLYNYGAGAQTFKQLELTRTRFGSVLKSQAVGLGVMLVCSFIFWSLIWGIAQIPSASYPFVQKMWPLWAYTQCIWVSSTLPSDRITCEDLDRDFEANALPGAPRPAWRWEKIGSIKGLFVDRRHAGSRPPVATSQPGDTASKIVMLDLPADGPPRAPPPDAAAILWIVDAEDIGPEGMPPAYVYDAPGDRLRTFWMTDRQAEILVQQTSGLAPLEIKPRKNFLKDGIKPKLIFGGLTVALAVFGVVNLLGGSVAFCYGMVGGHAMWPHMAIPQMIGALLGRYYFARRFGEANWRAYTPVLLAGYACGTGLVAMLSIGFALLIKAVTRVII